MASRAKQLKRNWKTSDGLPVARHHPLHRKRSPSAGAFSLAWPLCRNSPSRKTLSIGRVVRCNVMSSDKAKGVSASVRSLRAKAVGLICLGIVMAPTPVPAGAVAASAGLALLTVSHSRMRRALRRTRSRHRRLDRMLCSVARILPGRLARVLNHTRPDPLKQLARRLRETAPHGFSPQ